MRVGAVVVVLLVLATGCKTSVDDTNAVGPSATAQAEPTAAALGPSATPDVFDGPDAVTAFILLSNPDPAAFDDALAETERRAKPNDVVLTVDVSDCDISLAVAIPRPENVVVRFYSEPVDCAVAVNYRALFVVPKTGTNVYGDWLYDGTPAVEFETRELSN